MQELIRKVMTKADLDRDEARSAMDMIMSGNTSPVRIAGLLIALAQKGETVEEVAGFVESMRNHAVKIKVDDPRVVDGCGTGGDGSNSFNISTAAAIVASAAGATVAKHGNRSVSSKCGSADLLEATGGKIDPGPEKVMQSITEIGFGFLFAPRFHPAMKHAAGPRRELGVRTVFNLLGPMTNPAGVKRQIIGVFDRSAMPLMADVLKATGSEHVILAHSHDGLDEFSISATTDFLELKAGSITKHTIEPTRVGLRSYPSGDVRGGEVSDNIRILTKVLGGERDAHRDAVLFNAGAMIYVADRVGSIKDGVAAATEAVDKGLAREKLDDWVKATNL